MTFAELIFFILFLMGIFFLLRPARARLEAWIYRRIKSGGRGSDRPIINIKDYEKKE